MTDKPMTQWRENLERMRPKQRENRRQSKGVCTIAPLLRKEAEHDPTKRRNGTTNEGGGGAPLFLLL